MVFYRSFYEAIKGLPKDIQIEIYSAILEYGLNGTEPANLKPTANGIFILIKPILDVNTQRFENGRKGAKYGSLGGRPRKDKNNTSASAASNPSYDKSFEHEVDQMRTEQSWIESVCMEFHISSLEVGNRLSSYLEHLNRECADKPHRNLGDAKRHFCSWMRKKYQAMPSPADNGQIPPDYSFNGGFGGQDV